MKRMTLCAALLALFVTSAAAADIRYSGSATIGTSILEAGAAEAFMKKSGIKFAAIEQTGSGKGLQSLQEGKASIAGAGRPLKSEEKSRKLIGTIIGYDAIAIFVHAGNPVTSLSKEQLKGIFTGSITNWKDLGGKDAPIVPSTEILNGKRATVEMFKELVLDDAAYGKGFKEIDQPKDQIVDLAANPNGICSVSRGLLDALPAELQKKVKAIAINGVEPTDSNVQSGAYLVSRPLLLVTQGLPKGEVKEFINFMLSQEGQGIVARSFVPVRK